MPKMMKDGNMLIQFERRSSVLWQMLVHFEVKLQLVEDNTTIFLRSEAVSENEKGVVFHFVFAIAILNLTMCKEFRLEYGIYISSC